MNVLIVMPLAEQRGGGELALLHLLQQGQRPDVRWCVVFLHDGPMTAQARCLGAETHVVPMGRLRRAHQACAAIWRIAAIARRFRADVILGWMAMGQVYGSLAARLAGVPGLWYQHGCTTGNGLDRLATRLPARGILACSQTAADLQSRLLRPARPMRVARPGVELERFASDVLPSPSEARALLGLPAEGPLLGIVGRLQRWKGMHVLLEALPAIAQTHPDAHVVIVGGEHAQEPEYPALLKERIAALRLEARVTLAGLQRNVPLWMQAMDVFVHASDREPFGMVILEAMALGKPVVAGDAGGPTEIITHGVNGLLTPYGDADALAHAVSRYLDDPDFAARAGAAAKQRAQEFSTQRYAQNVIDAVRALADIRS